MHFSDFDSPRCRTSIPLPFHFSGFPCQWGLISQALRLGISADHLKYLRYEEETYFKNSESKKYHFLKCFSSIPFRMGSVYVVDKSEYMPGAAAKDFISHL